MPVLFHRVAAVVVGTGGGRALRIDALDFSFTVVKNLRREPNTCSVEIYNLSDTSRLSIEGASGQQLRLEAGYANDSWAIFEGEVRRAWTEYEGAVDRKTTIEGGDGERAFRVARVNRSFGEGTSLRSVIAEVATSMGLGVGNLEAETQGRGFEGLGSTYAEGCVVSGSGRESLSGLCRSIGLEWSVQDGNLQLLPFREAVRHTAVLLTPDTGLIGSPSIDSEGVMHAKALIIPGIFPGRKIDVRSRYAAGVFRAAKTTFTGSTAGPDWYVDIEGRVING